MTIETLLSNDFAALVERLQADDFAERVLAKLNGVARLRLAVVGAAGAAGAAIAATQFNALAGAVAEAAPSLASLTIANTSYTFGAAPALVAALLFALVGGATAFVMPGPR